MFKCLNYLYVSLVKSIKFYLFDLLVILLFESSKTIKEIRQNLRQKKDRLCCT